ncbi:DUF58 domain-containing protein [Kocuria rhizophila]|nr:DUF58 domain-containing protein [Kocuria rhizophila]
MDVHDGEPLLGADQDFSVPGVRRARRTRCARDVGGSRAGPPPPVRVSDPFGVVTELLDVAERASLHVAPDAEPLSEHGACQRPETGNDPSRRAQLPAEPDNVTTREYRHGDPMRRVHWAASARHGELMVRRKIRAARRAVLVLDCVAPRWPGATVRAGVLESARSSSGPCARPPPCWST